MSAADLEADLRTTHDEPEPLDSQLEDEPTSIAGAGTRIHQVMRWMKSDNTPRTAAHIENPRLQIPSVVTYLVLVSEAWTHIQDIVSPVASGKRTEPNRCRIHALQ